jgi:antitoxin (DNA-binding transcriptional repressor) of toxin-antitoxin stability system
MTIRFTGSGATLRANQRTVRAVREIPVEQVPEEIAAAAQAAAGGEIVYLTQDGERLAAIVPSGYAVELEDLAPDEVLVLLDEMAADQPEG